MLEVREEHLQPVRISAVCSECGGRPSAPFRVISEEEARGPRFGYRCCGDSVFWSEQPSLPAVVNRDAKADPTPAELLRGAQAIAEPLDDECPVDREMLQRAYDARVAGGQQDDPEPPPVALVLGPALPCKGRSARWLPRTCDSRGYTFDHNDHPAVVHRVNEFPRAVKRVEELERQLANAQLDPRVATAIANLLRHLDEECRKPYQGRYEHGTRLAFEEVRHLLRASLGDELLAQLEEADKQNPFS